MFRSFTVVSILLLLSFCPARGQVSAGGKPVSFQRALKKETPVITMPTVDVEALLAEDSVEQEMGLPFRFGFPHEVNLDLNNSGVWETLDDGSRVWRLAIKCPGAFSINLIYGDFQLPPGAKLHLYSQNRGMLIGAFTEQNNKDHRKFATSPIKGEMIILEYYLPPDAKDPGRVSISNVVHGYKPVFFRPQNLDKVLGFGDAGECNINVNCPEGLEWGDEIRSVGLITLDSGSRLCSGALVNNVRQDGTPYFLTANHCLGTLVETWVIIFNYESPICENIDGPLWMSVAGTTKRANYLYSDFALLELNEQPPDSYNVFYAGWSAVDDPALSTVGISHPSGDVKKIALNDDPVRSTNFLGSAGDSHWEVDNWELGTTEPGSSGSPLFDQDHLVVGQLHGGYASCVTIGPDFYGKFAASWDYGGTPESRLRDWLDPDNTGTLVLPGLGATTPRVNFIADTMIIFPPQTVNFSTYFPPEGGEWSWDFGDGSTAFVREPSHTYETAGVFDVHAEVLWEGEVYSKTREDYIYAMGDTIKGDHLQVETGSRIVLSIRAHNTLPLNYILIPCEYFGELPLVYDSFSTTGCRTDYFADQTYKHYDIAQKRVAIRLRTSIDGSQPQLEPGEGEIARLHFTVPESAELGQLAYISHAGYLTYLPSFQGSVMSYEPKTMGGSVLAVSLTCCTGIRGNVDSDPEELIGSVDVVYFIDWLFNDGSVPGCFREADVDGDGISCILDLDYLVRYIWMGGVAPKPCY